VALNSKIQKMKERMELELTCYGDAIVWLVLSSKLIKLTFERGKLRVFRELILS
jgi:hypothetical protein